MKSLGGKRAKAIGRGAINRSYGAILRCYLTSLPESGKRRNIKNKTAKPRRLTLQIRMGIWPVRPPGVRLSTETVKYREPYQSAAGGLAVLRKLR